jgi:hypothetical protein
MRNTEDFDNNTLNNMATDYRITMSEGTPQYIREYLAGFEGNETLLNEVRARAINDDLTGYQCAIANIGDLFR